ncbi:MAG TPA: permease [Firmicutes bacterium]|jgi:uncharacterized membrane protein YraQ (UPF0718 family)|nr:permease [Bacillota bacterium]
MFTLLLYFLALGWLIYSWFKDRGKTKQALKKGVKSFLAIFPSFATVLLVIGLMFTFISPDFISRLIGNSSGFLGMLVTSVLGAVTLIPGFVAFPLAASLIELGAGVMQVAVFISTLMTVGIVTAPLEIKYFGRKAVIWRNGLNYVFAFIVAFIIGKVVQG